MKKTIHYSYIRVFLPSKRCKKQRSMLVTESMNANLKEVTEEEFPVAFRVTDLQSVQEGMTGYNDYDSDKCKFEPFTETIRVYRNKLYKPVRITHGAAISTVLQNSDYLLTEVRIRLSYPLLLSSSDLYTENSVIISETKESEKRKIRRIIDNYVSFNGFLWCRCGEPAYTYATFGLGKNHGGTALFIDYLNKENTKRFYYFNALHKKEAVEYVKNIALQRGDTESVESIGEDREIEVLIPEMVKLKLTNIKDWK